jgi:hypothetical protein
MYRGTLIKQLELFNDWWLSIIATMYTKCIYIVVEIKFYIWKLFANI